MSFRSKPADAKTCPQIVENQRENGRARRQVIATVGGLNHFQAAGELAALLLSGGRFCETLTGLMPILSGDWGLGISDW